MILPNDLTVLQVFLSCSSQLTSDRDDMNPSSLSTLDLSISLDVKGPLIRVIFILTKHKTNSSKAVDDFRVRSREFSVV